MPRLRLTPMIGLVLVAASCSSDSDRVQPARTQRQRDSVIGASNLPGAGGVGGALGANNSAAARNARLDSIANQP